MRRLENHVSLITGAAAGIGRATAERFAAEGATLLLCDVQDEGLAETADRCRAAGAEAKALHCDVGSDAQVDAAVAAAVKHFGRLDSLCNIAGILKFEHTTDLATEDFQRILDVNLVGTFRMCRKENQRKASHTAHRTGSHRRYQQHIATPSAAR